MKPATTPQRPPEVPPAPEVPAGVEPLRIHCEHCRRDISGRCTAAVRPNGEVLFVNKPLVCPRCGTAIVFVKEKSLVIHP